jgi:hypothetical protein
MPSICHFDHDWCHSVGLWMMSVTRGRVYPIQFGDCIRCHHFRTCDRLLPNDAFLIPSSLSHLCTVFQTRDFFRHLLTAFTTDLYANWSAPVAGACISVAPRFLGPPEQHKHAFPECLDEKVGKRVMKGKFVRMHEFTEFQELYRPASDDNKLFLAAPSERKDSGFCPSGIDFRNSFDIFAKCMTALYPSDKLMADELKSYEKLFVGMFQRFPARVVSDIEEHVRTSIMKQHTAYWPITPAIFYEIISMQSAYTASECAQYRLQPQFNAPRSTPTASREFHGSDRVRAADARPSGSARATGARAIDHKPSICRNFNIVRPCFLDRNTGTCLHLHACPCGVNDPAGHKLVDCPRRTPSLENILRLWRAPKSASKKPSR